MLSNNEHYVLILSNLILIEKWYEFNTNYQYILCQFLLANKPEASSKTFLLYFVQNLS